MHRFHRFLSAFGVHRFGLLITVLIVMVPAATIVVTPTENSIALKNSLKGIRGRSGGQMGDYATLSTERDHLCWNMLETQESDGIDKIRDYCNSIWADYPARNIKVIARIMGTWPGSSQVDRYPSDVIWDENNAQFQARVLRLVERLGIVWDNDPRIAFVETGIAGSWGEGCFSGTFAERFRDAWDNAFKNKKTLKRYTGCYEPSTWGIYWDSFAHPDQIGTVQDWVGMSGGNRWKTAVVGGEVAYDWGNVAAVLGSSLSASLSTPAYYNRLVNVAYRIHATQEGSSGGANISASPGAELYQKALGYRFILDTLSYPSSVQSGQSFSVSFAVRNVGSSPFYYPWPVQLALLDKTTHQPVWTDVFSTADIRTWLPGSNWNMPNTSDAEYATLTGHSYSTPAQCYHENGTFTIPSSLPKGEYVLAIAVLDRDGGMLPNLRFAINNYWQGGYHPMGIIGVGNEPATTAVDPGTFFTGRNDATLHYIVPAPDNTPPSTPGGLTGQATGQSTISLSWNAASDAESGVREYNVYRDGVKIATVPATSYTDQGLASASTFSYQVSAVNNQVMEGAKCSPVSVSTGNDITPPTVSVVSAAGAATQVFVVFSEPVEQASAQNAGNYAVDNSISVSAASLGTDLRTLALTVSSLTKSITYTLTVNNIRDRAVSPNTIATNTTAQFQYTDALTRIRFYPRPGLPGRMAGGVFEATNGDKDSGPYTALYTIPGQPADNQWTEVTNLSNASTAYHYVRYRGAGFCNVAEIEFYRGIEKVNGTVFGTPGSWGNSGSDYTKTFDGDISTFMDYTADVGGYTGMDLYGAATVPRGVSMASAAGNLPLRFVSQFLISIPSGAFELRVVNAAGATVLRETGIGPKTCDLSSVGKGIHFVTVTSGAMTCSKSFLNDK